MRKIILLLMILFSLPLHSQTSLVCENVQVAVQVNSSTCPDAASLQVDVLFFPGENQIQFVVLNLINTSTSAELHIEFPNPDPSSTQIVGVSQTIESLIPGDEYEIEAIIYSNTGEISCPVQGSPFLIPECSTLNQDGDNFTADVDCDDRNSNIYPGATEICNQKDDDCDGIIDDGVNYIYYWDEDDDGYGDESRPVSSCSSTATNKLSIYSTDCNDQEDTINPGANEICGNNIDDNCDGNIDEGCSCPDADSDGVCDADDNCPDLANPSQEPDEDCDGVPTGIDCNDTDSTITSTNVNDADCDGVPTAIDCDDSDDTITSTNENDADCDGVPTDIDCDDSDGTITTTNENDADCDGVPTGIDCDDSDDTVTTTNENDSDCDGVPTGVDCDDSDDTVTTINENDADCDGVPTGIDCDDSDETVTTTNENDADCDGVPTNIDCDDSDDTITTINENDADCDGVPTSEDCNDNDPTNLLIIGADTDNDGILDCSDAELNSPCPSLVDNRGISLDSDNDGTLDCNDECPGDRLKILEGSCGCGIQDADTDGDAILDCNDLEVRSKCTSVDANGVVLDTDGDGVLDCNDLCPGEDDRLDADNDKIPDACDDYTFNRGEPICHIGSNGNSKTLYVSPQQKARHIAHGDQPGPCTSTAAQVLSADVNTLSEDQVVLYPNPASQELNVQVNSSLSSGAVLSVHDFNGYTFMQIPVSGGSLYTIELDNRFVSGMYFVKITDGASEVTKQFVVKQ